MNSEILDMSKRELNRAHELYSNYLEKRNTDSAKAGEHLWGAINNLASGIYRMETGTGIGQHVKVRGLIKDLSIKKEVDFNDFKDAETLHSNFYHNFLSVEEWNERMNNARKLYDSLDRLLSGIMISQ